MGRPFGKRRIARRLAAVTIHPAQRFHYSHPSDQLCAYILKVDLTFHGLSPIGRGVSGIRLRSGSLRFIGTTAARPDFANRQAVWRKRRVRRTIQVGQGKEATFGQTASPRPTAGGKGG